MLLGNVVIGSACCRVRLSIRYYAFALLLHTVQFHVLVPMLCTRIFVP
jgi:hypothetical protein